jgi:hypothetical protein
MIAHKFDGSIPFLWVIGGWIPLPNPYGRQMTDDDAVRGTEV